MAAILQGMRVCPKCLHVLTAEVPVGVTHCTYSLYGGAVQVTLTGITPGFLPTGV